MAKPTKKSTKKEKTWRRYAGKTLKLGGKVAIKQLKAALGLNTEEKYVDTVTNFYSFPNTIVATSALSNIATPVPQGLTAKQRSGDTFRMTSLSFRGALYNGPANLITSTTARIIIVNWKHTPVSATNVADILEVTNDVNSLRTDQPANPHTILYDKTFALGATADYTNPNVRKWSWSYSPLDHHVGYTVNDTTGAVGNVIQGYIQIYLIASSFTAGNAPYLGVYQRMKFVDN